MRASKDDEERVRACGRTERVPVRAARGDVDGAVAMLERAEEGLRASAMEGYADAAALRRADLRRDFDALDAAADALRAKGVVNPRRYAWLRAPGPWD